MKNINMEDLLSVYNKLKPGEVILDVRSKEEFDSGHVPGSINIVHENVKEEFDKIKNFNTFYVYCRSGGRVHKACQSLEELGVENIFKVVHSGMPNWIEAGHEVKK